MAQNPNAGRQSTVSHEDVAIAVKKLQQEGIAPSVRSVRDRLGRGSNTTIKRLLDDVLAGIESPDDQLAQFAPRLQALCLEMADHLHAVLQERLAARTAELERREKEADARVAMAKAETDNTVQELILANRQIAEYQERLASLEQQMIEAQHRAEGAAAAASEAKARALAMEERAVRAERDAEHARQQRDHFESHISEQRRIEGERHAQQLAQLQAELESSNARQVQQAEQGAQLQAETARLRAQLTAATAEQMAAKKTADDAAVQLATLNDLVRQLGSQNEKLSEEIDSVRKEAAHEAKERGRLQSALLDAKEALLTATAERASAERAYAAQSKVIAAAIGALDSERPEQVRRILVSAL